VLTLDAAQKEAIAAFDKWVDEKLSEILQSLPPSFVVKVDPIDLL